jgi:hypothetical protein
MSDIVAFKRAFLARLAGTERLADAIGKLGHQTDAKKLRDAAALHRTQAEEPPPPPAPAPPAEPPPEPPVTRGRAAVITSAEVPEGEEARRVAAEEQTRQDQERMRQERAREQEAQELERLKKIDRDLDAVVRQSTEDALKRALDQMLASIAGLIRGLGILQGDRKRDLGAKLVALQAKRADPNAVLTEIDTAAQALLEQALTAKHDGTIWNKDKKLLAARNEVYAKVLEAQYGFKVSFGDGGDRKSLAKVKAVQAALALVPPEHVTHSSLKKVDFGASDFTADYGIVTKVVSIDAAKVAAKPPFQYMVDGQAAPIEAIDAATLHELGHAVDDKAKIMKDVVDAPAIAENLGGWKSSSTNDIAWQYWNIYLAPQIGEGRAGLNEIRVKVRKLLEAALDGKQPGDLPSELTEEPLRRLVQEKIVECQALCANKEPWKTPPAPIAGRVYHRGYPGHWYSYSRAARDALSVCDYQWRSPVEWFAELYTVSWLKQKPMPVGEIAERFMFRPKA